MRKYLATLHKRPEHHKKRFALLVSGVFTLFIFSIWTLVTFGEGGVLAREKGEKEEASAEVGPFESFKNNVATSVEGIFGNFGKLKDGLETVDIESDYTEMRNNVLEVYGQ